LKLNQISKSFDRSWVSSLYLVLLVSGAAAGALSGLTPAMMIAGTALAMISWELLDQIICRRRGDVLPSLKDPKWAHFKVLVTSVGFGLLLAEGGLHMHFSLPFGIVVLAVFLILFSYSRFYRLNVS